MTIGRGVYFTSKQRITYHITTPIIINSDIFTTYVGNSVLDDMRSMESNQLKQSVRLCKAVVSIEICIELFLK